MEAHDSTPEATGAPATPNGTIRPGLGVDADTLADIAAELRQIHAALESVDMRLAAQQAGTFLIVGLVVLLLILEAREARKLIK